MHRGFDLNQNLPRLARSPVLPHTSTGGQTYCANPLAGLRPEELERVRAKERAVRLQAGSLGGVRRRSR